MNAIFGHKPSPTQKTYSGLNAAYGFFNTRLFNDELPECLITIQRKKGSYGYFARERFGNKDGEDKTDEIALNPAHFRDRSTEEVLSTLVHEMVHLWQYHFGKPSRPGYHNKEWAAKMEAVGLIPSATGREGGKKTGQKMSHYIEQDGAFAAAATAIIEDDGFYIPYVDLWADESRGKARKKATSKTKYSCPSCALNVWGKPGIKIICAECAVLLEADQGDG